MASSRSGLWSSRLCLSQIAACRVRRRLLLARVSRAWFSSGLQPHFLDKQTDAQQRTRSAGRPRAEEDGLDRPSNLAARSKKAEAGGEPSQTIVGATRKRAWNGGQTTLSEDWRMRGICRCCCWGNQTRRSRIRCAASRNHADASFRAYTPSPSTRLRCE